MRDELFKTAVTQLRAGDKTTAESTIKDYLRRQPEDSKGWWVLAHATADTALKRKSLERVVTLDPDHSKAQSMLDALEPDWSDVPVMPKQGSGKRTARASGGNKLRNLMVFTLLLVVIGGGFVYAALNIPAVTNLVFGGGRVADAYAYDPFLDDEGEARTLFSSSADVIVYVELEDVRRPGEVRTEWYEIYQGERYLVHNATVSGISHWARFQLRWFDHNWYLGPHEVDVFLNDELQRTVEFTVE